MDAFSIRRKVEDYFKAKLTPLLSFPVFTSKADEEVDPPFLVAISTNAKETVTKQNVYNVDLQLVLVTDTSAAAADHELAVAQLKEALDTLATQEQVPYDADPAIAFRLYGFAIVSVTGNGSDEDSTWGDTWTLIVGAAG